MILFHNSLRPYVLAAALALGLGVSAGAQDVKPTPADQSYPLAVCVVSGDKLGGDMGQPTIIHYEGREVRFCCPDCEKDFRKDPQKYLKKIDEAAAKAASTTQPAVSQPATVYQCPMHPDVKADKPSKCPKCGMALQAQNPESDTPTDHGHQDAGHGR